MHFSAGQNIFVRTGYIDVFGFCTHFISELCLIVKYISASYKYSNGGLIISVLVKRDRLTGLPPTLDSSLVRLAYLVPQVSARRALGRRHTHTLESRVVRCMRV